MRQYFKLKNILLSLLVIFIIIQFIRPAKNLGEAFGRNDITQSVDVPENIKNILVTSCFDCHSNKTNHMWYENIQPIGWWIGNHIKEGKRELNFSEFNTYKDKRKAHKFEEIGEMISEKEMPLSSYTLIHGDAALSDEQIEILISWASQGQQRFDMKVK